MAGKEVCDSMRFFLAFFIFGFALSTFTGAADSVADDTRVSPVVIELFASQNCPACPKAHKTLKDVKAAHDDVLVLTWSVDYWDYLGEADPMAMPEAKARQSAYTERMKLRAPYTPQSIYDGVKQCPATRRRQVEANIAAQRKARNAADPTLSQQGALITVEGDCPIDADVLLVEYLPDDAHETGMVNPVVAKQIIGPCKTESNVFAVDCDGTCAVLLQGREHGAVYAALNLDTGPSN